jgi:hypothetical protein
MKRDTANAVGDTTEGVVKTESAIFVRLNRTWTELRRKSWAVSSYDNQWT